MLRTKVGLLATRTAAVCRPNNYLLRSCRRPQRWFSVSMRRDANISIHFATTSGTAQLFAHELQSTLQERAGDFVQEVTVANIGDTPQVETLDPDALHLFLVSTAGVGELPSAAKPFAQSIETADASNLSKIKFGVFGLGNSAAHPHHFNVAGKMLHASLVDHKAHEWLPLALGDDGDCIEEDFDEWQDAVIQRLRESSVSDTATASEVNQKPIGTTSSSTSSIETATNIIPPLSEESPRPDAFGKRLQLVPIEVTEEEITRTDLLDTVPQKYHPDAERWRVAHQFTLSAKPKATSLRELEIELDKPLPDKAVSYDAGDHVVVYPSQADFIVEAYLKHWNISENTAMHSKVELAAGEDAAYPHPTGISLYDTLRFCVDLQAPPGPRLARSLAGREDIDYKEEVYNPRQSPLAILKQYKNTNFTLEDLLFHLPPIAPRYYSIASSPSMHRNSIFVTYRPLHYITAKGSQQSGLCTSYLSELKAGSTLVAYINRNPDFRLPAKSSAPVILMGAGCGIAAIRSLVEELAARRNTSSKTPIYIFLGFRNATDAAYIDLMQSVEPEMLEVSYSSSCARSSDLQMITDRVRERGATVYDLLANQGASLYACGGARTFGAAIQRELHDLYTAHGDCTPEQAQEKLQDLVREGRYCEDLAD